jgi:hypothetical protein
VFFHQTNTVTNRYVTKTLGLRCSGVFCFHEDGFGKPIRNSPDVNVFWEIGHTPRENPVGLFYINVFWEIGHTPRENPAGLFYVNVFWEESQNTFYETFHGMRMKRFIKFPDYIFLSTIDDRWGKK